MNPDVQIQVRLNALIEKGKKVATTEETPDFSEVTVIGYRLSVDTEPYAEWRNQALVCLTDIFGSTHPYTKNFESRVSDDSYTSNVKAGVGILRAALEDLEDGYLGSLKEMAAAEVFSDFLDQADHLLEHGYHIPAASLTGAVLENSLRSLAKQKNIPVRTKDSLTALNNKLAAKNVYSRLRYKQVAFWIDVRNAADHGEFAEVAKNDVTELVKGVQNFLAEEL